MLDPIESLRSALARKGISQAELARKKGYTKQALNQQLKNNYLRATEWVEMMDQLGVDVVLVDRNTGKELVTEPYVKGFGPAASGYVDRVRYDTTKADAISTTFSKSGDGDKNGEELYLTRDGQYFLVDYADTAKPKIIVVEPKVAIAFMEKYGVIDDRVIPKEM